MSHNFGKLFIGVTIALGMSAFASNSVQAGTLTGATIGGTAASDYVVYGVNAANNTFVVPNTPGNIAAALTGNAASPTGNVELRASSEQGGFDFTKNTTLSGQIGGKNITLSSLTASDWGTTNYKNSGKTFGRYWFDSALTANNVSLNVNANLDAAAKTTLFNIFQTNGGFQRFSDPKISYVNQNDTTGEISIGLAGHLNATSLLLPYFTQYVDGLNLTSSEKQIMKTTFASKQTQASEIVKYTYNGTTDYLFSFTGTNSGLVSNDATNSHNANYEVTIAGVPPTKVPEPSVMLGMFGVAGIFAAQRKLKKVSA
ncbi:MAG: NF038130 family PEP-CTERM protein [Cuspidothrix sp.]